MLKVSSVSAAVILSIGLVIGYDRRASLHRVLASRFSFLESKMVPLQSYSDEKYQEFYSERLAIESEEPPKKSLLNALCDYELRRATRRDLDEQTMEQVGRIPWIRRAFSQLISQPSYVAEHLKS